MSKLASILRNANTHIIKDGDVKAIGEFFDSNYIVNFGGSEKSGHGAIRGFTNAIHKAFAKISVNVDIFLESDKRISWQRTIRGTHTGKFQGFPPSGYEITWRDMVVSQFDNDKIKEEWVVSDLAESLLRARKR